MPTTPKHNSFVDPFTVDQIKRLNPKSVVDVGPGDGFYAKLIHHICDNPPEIIGVELNSRWVNHCNALGLYKEVIEGSIRDKIENLSGSLIIFGDVLEHLEKEEAVETLRLAINNFEWVIINGPIGFQPQAHSEPAEVHRCGITTEDFKDYTIDEYNEIPNLMMNCLLKGNNEHLDS